jgi:YHS domain-containing protein
MTPNTVVDPVRGARLDSAKTPIVSDYEGVHYFFCSEACKHRFDRDPEAYLELGLTATDKTAGVRFHARRGDSGSGI